jgi:hypothetical protein
MSVAWRIWAHPVRRAWVHQLAAQLDADVPIVYDENPVPSRDPAQRWAVCQRLLRTAAADGHEYVGWIQDDAVVCRDFTATVDAALKAATNPIVMSPYTGRGRPDQAAVARAVRAATTGGHPWMSLRSLYWGVAVVMPTSAVEPVLRIGSRSAFRYSPSDYRVGVVLRDRLGLQTWYTLPSLAEHRDADSLVGHDKPGQERVAHDFLGTDRSGLEIDWSNLPPRQLLDGGLEPRTDTARGARMRR